MSGGRIDPIVQLGECHGTCCRDLKPSQLPALLSNNTRRQTGLWYLDVTLLWFNPFIYDSYFYFGAQVQRFE